MLKVDGRTFRQMMLYMLRDDAFLDKTEFYQLSHELKLTYSRSRKEIVSLTYQGKEMANDDIFTVGLQNYHYCNLESFFGVSFDHIKTFAIPKVISTSCLDILEEYLSSHKAIRQDVESFLISFDTDFPATAEVISNYFRRRELWDYLKKNTASFVTTV